MANQAYYTAADGTSDFWQALVTTNPGDTPESAPASWRKIKLFAEWRRVLSKLTYAGLLELDGQTDKAALHMGQGQDWLDDLAREAARQEEAEQTGDIRAPQGQTVNASVIIEDAFRMIRWDTTQLEDEQKQDGRICLSQALQMVWDAWWWNCTMKNPVQMTLRPAWVAGQFTALGTEVYFPQTRKYYLCIAPNTNIPPESNGVLNSGFWAPSQPRYNGNDYVSGTATSWGTVVRNPADGLFYQRGGSLQVTAAGNADGLGVYVPCNFNSGLGIGTLFISPQSANPSAVNRFEMQGQLWTFTVSPNGSIESLYDSINQQPLTPDLVTTWEITPTFSGPLPGPTLTALFVQPDPPDTGSWGLLSPFDPVLTIATRVKSVSRHNPTLSRNPEAYRIQAVDGGVRLTDFWTGRWYCQEALVTTPTCPPTGPLWVYAKRVTPILTGDAFDATESYDATPTNQIVFDA